MENFSLNKIIISATVFALLTLNPAHAANKKATFDLAQQIELVALGEIKTTGVPSVQVSVGSGGRIIYEGAFGLADIENEVKATPHSKYRTASIAKWFTATAAMSLAEKEALDLDKPIQSYCSDYPEKQGMITTRQLLSHTSGIRHYVDYEAVLKNTSSPQQRAVLEKKMMQEALSSYTRHTDVISPLNTFKDDDLLFQPGTNWEYSSYGYRVLACVLQGATNTPYVNLMEDIIFGPAKMNATKPDDAWAIIPHRVTGYRLENGVVRRAELRDVSENLPAGGYLSTASDLVRFAVAFDDGLVSAATKQLMSSPVSAPLDSQSEASWRDAIPQKDKYGYGLMLLTKYEDGMVGHTGRQAGGSAVVVLFPNADTSIAVMTNAKGWNGYFSFVMKIRDILNASADERFSFNKNGDE